MAKRRAWIRTVSEAEATGELKRLYERVRDRAHGWVDNILAVHSLNPRTLRDHWELYRTVMKRQSGLSHAEREMMAVLVSALNQCHY